MDTAALLKKFNETRKDLESCQKNLWNIKQKREKLNDRLERYYNELLRRADEEKSGVETLPDEVVDRIGGTPE